MLTIAAVAAAVTWLAAANPLPPPRPAGTTPTTMPQPATAERFGRHSPARIATARGEQSPAAGPSTSPVASPWTGGKQTEIVSSLTTRPPAGPSQEPIHAGLSSLPTVPPAAGPGADRLRSGQPVPGVRGIVGRRMRVTAYCPCPTCCGRWAVGELSVRRTATGLPLLDQTGRLRCLVAADLAVLPAGTLVRVPGYAGGRPVPVADRGGAIRGDRLDVLMPTHAEARAWGVRTLDVRVIGRTGR